MGSSCDGKAHAEERVTYVAIRRLQAWWRKQSRELAAIRLIHIDCADNDDSYSVLDEGSFSMRKTDECRAASMG
jgi:hypothetical protein